MESSNKKDAPRPSAALHQCGQNFADFTSWLKKCSNAGLGRALDTNEEEHEDARLFFFCITPTAIGLGQRHSEDLS